jgi:hypothetical protein
VKINASGSRGCNRAPQVPKKKGSTDAEWPADEDASNPHGGTDGSKVLVAETFVLIDVG